MVSFIVSTAVSGLQAQARALQVSASNIANSRTTGKIPDGDTQSGVYRPGDTTFSAVEGGGVRADFVARDPAFIPVYAPDSLDANADGLVAAPNVSIDEELVNSLVAINAYKANVAVLETAKDVSDELLDVLA